MVVKFLASALVTGLLLTAKVGAAQTAAPDASLGADSSFIATAGSLGLLQVQLGKLAQQKGKSSEVKAFGARMVAEYSKLNEELAAGAKGAAYPAPVILRDHQKTLDLFVNTAGGSFDKKYMAEMVNEHGEAARLYQQESEHGRVTSLKELASRLLPTVQQHQSLARETAGQVGVEVTTTTAEARQGS
jgi:putative membrane protein